MDRAAAVVTLQSRNVGIGVALTLFFGGLGLFYASIIAGIIGGILEIAFLIFVIATLGFGILLLPVVHIIYLIPCVILINMRNRRILNREFGPK